MPIAEYDRSMETDPDDEVLVALDSLIRDLEENIEASHQAIRLADQIRALRRQGHSYTRILDETGRPLVVELITENLERLQTSGASVRQAHAAALHAEGMTMDQIADLFGVTRQRISAVIRHWRESDLI